ncbi:MAG: universal stress protein [Prevotellaceae bacterium]|jgi:nucleotide-binding universal stress UspA family protein|nr:universal stress protein [Prevotellaceae bacterium]
MNIDQIFIAITQSVFPQTAFEYAEKTARAFEKEICLMAIDENAGIADKAAQFQTQTDIKINFIEGNRVADFTETLEKLEASMIIFELGNKRISQLLKLSRDLRIPYIFVKKEQKINFQKVVVPVSFLIEDREKGRFSAQMGRFLHSELLLMPARDFGSKARANANAIVTLYDKFNLSYREIPAQKDSFSVQSEALSAAGRENAGLIIITASRDYSIDDMLFGTQEQRIIQRAEIPVMVVNPREDLYVLCG